MCGAFTPSTKKVSCFFGRLASVLTSAVAPVKDSCHRWGLATNDFCI